MDEANRLYAGAERGLRGAAAQMNTAAGDYRHEAQRRCDGRDQRVRKVPRMPGSRSGGRRPQVKVVGSNFPAAYRLDAALVGEDTTAPGSHAASDGAAAIPTKPTHVVIAPVKVCATAAAAGTDLPPGAQVTLVQTKDGWTVVAREGKKLGYVKADALASDAVIT